MTSLSLDNWQVRCKIWIEIDNRPVIGEGRLAMLTAIDQEGSIISAARRLQISYRKIRGAILDMERSVGVPLVRTYRGGEEGGGARLTAEAVRLVDQYLRVNADFQAQSRRLIDNFSG